MDARDRKISRKLRRIAERCDAIVREETGGENCVFGLVVQPVGQPGEIAEFQYISNGPREHMHEALRYLVNKWDAGAPDVPPHKKN